MNLLVLAGGKSAEQDISRISAATVIKGAPRKYRVALAHIGGDGRWTLERDPQAFARHPHPDKYRFSGPELSVRFGKRWLWAGSKPVPVDAVFPVLHGPMGEDGTVQGLLELAGAPYVGSDVLGSSVGMDKEFSKLLAARAGLPMLPWGVLNDPALAPRLAKALRYPIFVKPARMGSSVGVSKVKSAGTLVAAVREALKYDTKAILEQGIDAREIECAVLGDPYPDDHHGPLAARASICGEIRPNLERHELYSYAAKYLDPNGSETVIPAALSKAQAAKVQAMALDAFAALGCYGLSRVDFLMDKKSGRIYFNEVNTIPGFTAISFYPRLWAESGVPLPALIDRLVALAVARFKARARLKTRP